jgi:hypothetical protein
VNAETPVFDAIRGRWPDKAAAWDLGKRPVRRYRSDCRVLDPGTAIVASCEPEIFRSLAREWHDQGTAHDLDEAVHQMELERAAQPPVIEVTVTTPPEGIPRAELTRLVREKVAEITAPDGFPALPDEARPARRGHRVLTATRRARDRLAGAQGSLAGAQGSLAGALPVSEDDTPTLVLPAVRDDDGPLVVEVHVP